MSNKLGRLLVTVALVIVGGVGHAIQTCHPDLAVLADNKTTVTNDGHTITVGGENYWTCDPRS